MSLAIRVSRLVVEKVAIVKNSLIGLVVMIAGSMIAFAGASEAYDRTTDAKKIAWMDRGKAAVREKVKDPESAVFRQVFFQAGKDGIPMTCGEVNARNGFGGFAGFQRFISAGRSELTFLEEQVEDFDVIWDRFCS